MKKTAHAPTAALRISARGLQQRLLVQSQLDDLLVERALNPDEMHQMLLLD
jgi:hypothetical protein